MAKLLKELTYLHNRIFKAGDKYIERSCVRYINEDDEHDHVNEIYESAEKITVGRTAAQIISGAVEDVELTFTCETEGATIYINEVVRTGNKITIDKGSTVSWAASKPGFKTATGTVIADSTKTVTIPALVEFYTLTFTCETEGATIKINGSVRTDNKITVEPDTEVSWEASKASHRTATGTVVADSTKTVTIPALTETCIVSINPITPADATVKISFGGQTYVQKSLIVDKGTEISIEVSKDGYQTYTETKVIETNYYKNVELDPIV